MTYPELLCKAVLSCVIFSCVPVSLWATGTDSAMKISISSTLPAMEGAERAVLFNARSPGGEQETIFTVVVEKKPIPRKEFILVEPPVVVWKSNGVWHESEVLDEKGKVDPFKRRISLKQKSDWGKEDRLSATVHYYEVREHPLPTNPDGSPADNGPCWLASDTDTLIAVAPEVEIESITFNHIPGNSDSDGIDLRTFYKGTDIVGPEWTPTGTQAVAYRAGVRPTVKVNFKLLPERLTRVKAKATETGLGLTWGIAEAWTDSDNGQFSGVTSVSSEVNKGDVTWAWSATGFNGVPVSGWNDFRETEFPVYKILDKPKLPWKEGAGTQKPWMKALDFAMDTCLAKRKLDKKSVITAESFALYNRNTYQSSARYYLSNGTVDLVRFMSENSPMNCHDSAALLFVFANLIGLESVPQQRMLKNHPQFLCHCYTVFDGKVYDCCSATTPLVVNMNFELYHQELEPYEKGSEIPGISFLLIKAVQ